MPSKLSQEIIFKAVEFFKSWNNPIKVVAKADSSGLHSAAIITKLLKDNVFSLSTCQPLQNIQVLAEENYVHYIFLACGMNQLKQITQHLSKKDIIIIDKPVADGFYEQNIHCINNDEPEKLTLEFAKAIREDFEDIIPLPAGTLNALGKMERSSLGIASCLKDKAAIKEAKEVEKKYRQEIQNTLFWFESNKETDRVEQGKGYIILKLKDDIIHTVIGEAASILSEKNNKTVLALAYTLDKQVKVSLRTISGNALELLGRIKKHNITSGGDNNAAGANFPLEDESKFLDSARSVLEQQSYEEAV